MHYVHNDNTDRMCLTCHHTIIATTNNYLVITELVKLDIVTVVSAGQDILASDSDIGESDGELHPHQTRVPDQGLGADGHQPVQGHQAPQSPQVRER